MLTQEILKSQLNYDPETGIFTWLINKRGIKINDIAGKKHRKGYLFISINQQNYQAHRLVFLYMTGRFPILIVDHINGNPSDNRWGNLREATASQNQQNSRIRSNNKSGYKGVSWYAAYQKWMVRCKVNGKDKFLGYFTDPVEASNVYNDFAKKIHGEFYKETRV